MRLIDSGRLTGSNGQCRTTLATDMDDAADCNLVSQRLIQELDMTPLKGAKLPSAESFQGKKAYVYRAYAIRVCLTNSLGTVKETTRTFYVVDFLGIDVILSRL